VDKLTLGDSYLISTEIILSVSGLKNKAYFKPFEVFQKWPSPFSYAY
jgi:hypothetical protein